MLNAGALSVLGNYQGSLAAQTWNGPLGS